MVLAVLLLLLLAGCAPAEERPPPVAGDLPPACDDVRRDVPGGTGPPDQVIESVRTYGASHPDEYGDMWVEGRGLVVAFTGRLDEHRAALDDLAEDASVEVVEVEHPIAELRDLQDEITQDMGEPVAGEAISAVGADAFANRVMVGLHRVTDAARAELAERYGADRICVEELTIRPLDD